jgi:hypothetical protein
MSINTFRRDKLRRLVQAGKVVLVSSYHYDEMCGVNQHKGKPMRVAMKPADWKDREEGVCYLTNFDFKSSSGYCWSSPNGVITLSVHSNCSYDFRILEAGQ